MYVVFFEKTLTDAEKECLIPFHVDRNTVNAKKKIAKAIF